MNKINKLCLVIVILALFCFLFPNRIVAAGLTWALVYPSQRESTAIKISPINPNLVYASIRLPDNFNLLKSIDGGINWVSVKNDLPTGFDVNWISLTSSSAGTVVISLWGSGIHLSENYGLTWVKLFDVPPSRSVEISPFDPNTIFAGVGGSYDGSGIYKTVNKGLTWEKAALIGNNAQIAIDKLNSSRIFVDADPYFYRSMDGGDSWTKLPITYTFSNSIIDNVHTDTIFTSQYDSGFGIYKSTDNGDTWERKSNTIASAAFRLAQDTDGSLYASRYYSGGGIWRSKDGAETWENIADPAWATASGNTWGLDARNGRILVSVQGLGIYAANADGSPIYPKHKACQNNACVLVDGSGSDSCQTDTQCLPPPTPPACDSLIVTQSSGEAPLALTANLQGHATTLNSFISNYQFDFGDGSGSSSTADNFMSHTYISPGTYTIKGYVIDSVGNISDDTTSCQANITATIPSPNPVVVIPGFGGSWSYKGLVLQQPTNYSDWELFPKFSDYYYQPLLSTLSSSGLAPNAGLLTFAYDWRKSLWESASSLDAFLVDKILAGKKANIVGHSMGGLVARYCYQFVYGCSDKINIIISGGSPYLGALGSYQLWEGGKITDSDPMMRLAEQLLISVAGRPWILNHDIARNVMPGVRDLLPIFDYLNGLPYLNMSWLGRNWSLESFQYAYDQIPSGKLIAFSGVGQKTPMTFNITKPGPIDALIGVWVDGKPTKTNYGDGDGTVLKTSSAFGIGDKFYSLMHSDYFNQRAPLADVLEIFNLTGTPVLSSLVRPDSFHLIYAIGNVTLSAQNESKQSLGTIRDNGKSVFVDSPQRVKILIKGQGGTNYDITSVSISPTANPVTKTTKGAIKKGQTLEYLL